MKTMAHTSSQAPRIPVVGVICLVAFLGYILLTTTNRVVNCQRQAPNVVQCQTTNTLVFGLIPQGSFPFQLQEVEVTSELSDRTPRGGVRFRHQLTLYGEDHPVTVNNLQRPLSGSTLRKQLQSYIRGEGPARLTLQPDHTPWRFARSVALALLLGIVAWGFWDVGWPITRPSGNHSSDDEDHFRE